MPFLVDSIGIVFSQMNIAVHLIVHPVLAVRRDARGDAQGGRHRPRDAHARILADDGNRPAARRGAGRASSSAACAPRSKTCAGPWPIFRAMLERVRAVANELDRAPLPVPKSHASEARALLAWMHDGHFVFLGYRYYQLKRGRSRDALVRDGASGLGILRERSSRKAPPPIVLTGPPAPAGARARTAGAHQGQHAVHRASRQLPRLRRREDLRRFRPGDRRTSLPRPVDFERLSQAAGGNSAAAPQARRGHRALRPARAEPRRQVRGQRHRDLPARRAVPDAGRRAHRQRARHRQSLRAPPRAAVRAPRQLRALLLLPRVRAARPLQHRGARTHRAHRARSASAARTSKRRCRSPTPCWRACTCWCARRRARAPVENIAGHRGRDRRGRRHLGRPAAAGADRARRRTRAPWNSRRATRRHSRPRIAPTSSPRRRSKTSPISKRSRPIPPLPQTQPARAAGDAQGRLLLRILQAGDPISISDILPMLENFGLRVVAEHPYQVHDAPSAPCGSRTSSSKRATSSAPTSPRSSRCSRKPSSPPGAATSKTTASIACCCAPALSAREIVVVRAYCRYLLQTGIPFSQAYMERVLVAQAPITRALVRLFQTQFALDGKARESAAERIRQGHPARARQGGEPRRRPHPAQLSHRDPRDAAH